jgi:hypothetical protein
MKYPASYQARQETLGLVRILLLGRRQVKEGKALPLAEAARPALRALMLAQRLLEG